MANQEENLKQIVSHAKEYGFIFPSSEIYDGNAWSTLGGVDSSNTLTATQFITPNTTGSLAARNKIDNGAMEVSQRGGAEVDVDSSTSVILIDRWRARGEGGGPKFLMDQATTAPYGFKNSLKPIFLL